MIGRGHGRFWSAGVCVAVGLAAGGCSGGDDLPRQAISGLVLLDGRPLSSGIVGFYPVRQEKSRVRNIESGSVLRKGRFSIARADGLLPGTYKVAIYAAARRKERRRADTQPGNEEEVADDLIPRRYNSDTNLEIEIKDVAIKEMRIALSSR
jgi:hypothetical protein